MTGSERHRRSSGADVRALGASVRRQGRHQAGSSCRDAASSGVGRSTRPGAQLAARGSRTLLAFIALTTVAGCGEQSTQLTVPETAATATPEIVASRMDLARIAEIASDPLMSEVLAALPAEKGAAASAAMNEFGAKVLTAPTESFGGLEAALLKLDDEQDLDSTGDESDADVASGVLDLYRDWTHVTLFGDEPASAGPSPR